MPRVICAAAFVASAHYVAHDHNNVLMNMQMESTQTKLNWFDLLAVLYFDTINYRPATV